MVRHADAIVSRSRQSVEYWNFGFAKDSSFSENGASKKEEQRGEWKIRNRQKRKQGIKKYLLFFA